MPSPRMTSRAPLVAAVLLGAAANWPRLPDAKELDAPPGEFSAERAVVPLEDWAKVPRPTGSTARWRVAHAVGDALTASGLLVRFESWPGSPLENLVASAPDTSPDGVWLVAHSDSVPQAPGAADDGLGLAVIVEVVRALSLERPPAGLHVLVTDGEELGLLGAEAHVAALGPAAEAEHRLVLNVEARGTEGPAYMFQTAGPEPELLAAWQQSGCRAQATSLAHTIYGLLPNDTDFTVFRAAGWWGYDFALIGGAWRYHTPEDTPANLSSRSVQAIGDCVIGLARSWLERPLSGEQAPRVYAQIGPWTPVLSPMWVRVLAVVPLVLVGRPRGILLGAVAWLAAVVGALCLSAAALVPLAYAWPGFTTLPGEALHPVALYVFAAMIGLGAGLTALRLLRSRAPDLGWLTVAVLGSALAAILLPTAGYALLPGAWASALRIRGAAFPATVAAFIAAFISGLLLGPVFAGAFVGLTSRMLPVLALLPLLLVGWLLPRNAP